MEEKFGSRNDVIMAGLGGMGVLSAGKILSLAALKKYRYVSWLPSYGVEKRGGLCECTVIFSNEEIASPIIDRAQSLIIFEGSQLKAFEPRILSGGIILAESSGMEDGREARDYKIIEVPGLEIAVSMGMGQINNLILLGSYVGVTDAVPPELIEEVEIRYKTRKEVLKRNQEAFRRGIELGRTVEG
jgi:2-oxoglutarate ferredoxin oxidoreductase subunit gamma